MTRESSSEMSAQGPSTGSRTVDSEVLADSLAAVSEIGGVMVGAGVSVGTGVAVAVGPTAVSAVFVGSRVVSGTGDSVGVPVAEQLATIRLASDSVMIKRIAFMMCATIGYLSPIDNELAR